MPRGCLKPFPRAAGRRERREAHEPRDRVAVREAGRALLIKPPATMSELIGQWAS